MGQLKDQEYRYFIISNEDGTAGLEYGWIVKAVSVHEHYVMVEEEYVNFGRRFEVLLCDLKEITQVQYEALSYLINEGFSVDFMIKVLVTGVDTVTGDLHHDLIKVIIPKIRNVVKKEKDEYPAALDIDEASIFMIAVRICEGRSEDAFNFEVKLKDVAALTENDDWSEVNACISEMIKIVEFEKQFH